MAFKIFNIFKNNPVQAKEDAETQKTVTNSTPQIKGNLSDGSIAVSNYGIATIKIAKKGQKGSFSSPKQVEKHLKDFINNDKYKIRINSELFSNLDKLDYENIDRHIKNIKIFLNMTINNPSRIVKNGYFYSKEGALAFEALNEILSSKSDHLHVAPLSSALEKYNPQTILTLQKRGLLDSEKISNNKKLTKIADMSDTEYADYSKKAKVSIQQTGLTYEELSNQLKEKVEPLMRDYLFKGFEKSSIFEDSVVAQLEILKELDNFPIKIKNMSLLLILEHVDINNINDYKKVLKLLAERTDIDKDTVETTLLSYDKNTEKIIQELLPQKDIPLSIILKHLKENKDNLSTGLISCENIIQKIINDPFIVTTDAIKNSEVKLTPTNVNITKLDPTNITSDSLCLVHMTDYIPENGKILSTRDKLQGSRNSVHFTVNHAVASHKWGSWEDKKYAILMPYDSTVELNGKKKFIEGLPNDLYTNGSIEIPEGSIIAKYNPDIKSGEIKISDFPDLKGVKLVESTLYPHQIAPTLIEKMGYSHIEADGPLGLFSYGKNNGNDVDSATENYYAWKKFCDTQDIKPMKHSGSAGEISENIIENIGRLCVNNSWHNKQHTKDFKKEIIEQLKQIKPLQASGYFVSYDIDKMINLIKESSTPKQAVKEMKNKFGFEPTIKYKEFEDYRIDINFDIYTNGRESLEGKRDIKELIKEELWDNE